MQPLVIGAALSMALVTGCQKSQIATVQNALLTEMSATSKAEIQDAIVTLKGGLRPQLADSVFMHSRER